jgi:ATP-dependent Clp protease ATP-binding subunit ClpC
MYKSPEAIRVRRAEQELADIGAELEELSDDMTEKQREEWAGRREELEAQLRGFKASWNPETNKPRLTAEDIAEVVSMWTGIPVTSIAGEESERLLRMEEYLHTRIIGQHEAIEAISKAVRRARAGLKDPRRPIGSFIFLGPTGVGKSELTKSLAEFMFGSEDALIQLDMSEFMERHTTARLVGAPPGYVGYEDAGQLTEAIRRRPYSIVVFDEIEKAHPEVFNMLLQIMEEGHLSDARGRKVDFRNAIIIMTSNVGADTIKRNLSLGFAAPSVGEAADEARTYDDMRKKVMEQLRRAFRPEFLNRVSATIVFRSLTREEIKAIVELELKKVAERVSEQALVLDVTDAAKDLLALRGYDAEYGARPLRRVITNLVEDRLSDGILSGTYKLGATVRIDAVDNEITLTQIENIGTGEPELLLGDGRESRDDNASDDASPEMGMQASLN